MDFVEEYYEDFCKANAKFEANRKLRAEECKSLEEIAKKLNIPYATLTGGSVNGPVILIKDLWEILSDETKLKELVSRVRNKAFW
jgi:hypothetical protein